MPIVTISLSVNEPIVAPSHLITNVLIPVKGSVSVPPVLVYQPLILLIHAGFSVNPPVALLAVAFERSL